MYLVCSGAEIAGEVIETGEGVEQLSKVTVCLSSLDPKWPISTRLSQVSLPWNKLRIPSLMQLVSPPLKFSGNHVHCEKYKSKVCCPRTQHNLARNLTWNMESSSLFLRPSCVLLRSWNGTYALEWSVLIIRPQHVCLYPLVRHVTLMVPLFTQECKWGATNCQESLMRCFTVTQDGVISYPLKEENSYHKFLHVRETGISFHQCLVGQSWLESRLKN